MLSRIRILALFILLLAGAQVLKAQQQIVFRNYSVADGLRSNTVWCISQDSQGYMWFGTKNGLSRFDGYQFKSYQFNGKGINSIDKNFVHAILKFDNNTFWLGTEGGVSILNLETETFTDLDAVKNNVVFDVVRDAKGMVWIATKTNGLYRYDPATKAIRNFRVSQTKPSISSNQIRKLALDKKGNLWIGTFGNGVDALDTHSFVIRHFKTDNSQLTNNYILTLYADNKDNIWIGTLAGGLNVYNAQTHTFKSYRKGPGSINDDIIRSIYQASNDKMYIGTEKGLNILNINTGAVSVFLNRISDPYSISSNTIYAIYHDREGGIWLGTFFGGVNYFQKQGPGFELYYQTNEANSLSGNAVSSFLEDTPGKFWVGTEDGGLNYFNSAEKTFKHYPFNSNQQNLSYHNIHSLYKDNGGNLWVGTFTSGLDIIDPKTGKVKQYSNKLGDTTSLSNNSVYCIYGDPDGIVWIGTIKGLNIYDPVHDNFKRVKEVNLDVNCIYSICEDDTKTIWFATYDSGLVGYNKRSKKWFHYWADGKNGSLSANKIISLLDDHAGNLWIGTDGGGLNRLDLNTRKIETVSAQSISANVIYGIQEDDHHTLWISTNDGLFNYNPKNGHSRQFNNWDYLQSRQFNYKASYKSSQGKLYFGGIKGFNAFYPDSLSGFNIQARVALTNFQLFNKNVSIADENSPLQRPVSYTDNITLAHNQNVVSFEYAALSYLAPQKVQYAYMLDGFDKGWNYVGDQRKATFTNLPPGNYTFKVKASVDKNAWNVPVTTINLVVEPPFYRTVWAYLFYFIVAIAAFIFIKRYLAIKNHKRNEIKLERLQVKKEKEFYNQKIEFFTAMAHEIRTPLSLITAPLEKLLEYKNWENDVQKQLSTMDENSNRLLDLVNQLLDFRRIESDIYEIRKEKIDLVALVRSVYTQFSAIQYQKGLNYTISTRVNQLMVQADPEALTKIFNNLLINAFKFTRSTVKISIDEPFTDASGQYYFRVCVEDDGIGIPSSEIDNIFTKFFKVSSGPHQYTNLGGTGIGLTLAKSLTEKHGGQLEVSSTPSVNTIFKVVMPFELADSPVAENIIPVQSSKDAADATPEIVEKALIMVLEDDASLIAFFDQSLHQEGYGVIKAGNGIEALEMLKHYQVDLILSDVMMPEMDGLEFCKQVKSSMEYSHIPLVLLTAKSNSEAEISGIENGADAYITKPFKWKHVTAVIKNLIDSHTRIKEKFSHQPFIPADTLTTNSRDKKFLERITEIIEARIIDPQLSVEELSRELAMSRSSLHKKLKSLSGHVPNEFIRLVRLKHAAKLLLTNEYNISEIGYMVGFNSHSYFSKCFYQQFKLTPTEFLENHMKASQPETASSDKSDSL